MIRTFITPIASREHVTLNFPDDYLGEELEVLVFKKTEGISTILPTATMADFWNTMSDESAEKLHTISNKMRNEWERDI